jgi:hypothetical protein
VRITRDGGRVYLRDRPALFWALGVFLLAGGAVRTTVAAVAEICRLPETA